MKKRLLATLLALALVLAALPGAVFAASSATAMVPPIEGPDSGIATIAETGGPISDEGKSGDLKLDKLTRQEITRLFEDNPLTLPDNVFEVAPHLSATYTTGKIKAEALEAAANRLNALRQLAGLPVVELDDSWNQSAQHGAVLLAVSQFSHTPAQPADMDKTFFDLAQSATLTSNIYAGVTLTESTDGFMDDSGASNVDRLGHRRWQLDPAMSKVGFGYAENDHNPTITGYQYGKYVDEKVRDNSYNGKANVDYDFIGWPASGYFPNFLMNANKKYSNWNTVAWSVTLNPSKYTAPNKQDITVTLTCEDDGKEWVFNGRTTYTRSDTGAYFDVNNDNFGVNNCIIFRPANMEVYEGVYSVKIEGLKDISGKAITLSYEVEFFDMEDIKLDIDSDMFTVDTAFETYDGEAKTKTIKGESAGDELVEDKDYTVKYENNVNAGEATITISAQWPYRGELTYTFEIDKAERDISLGLEYGKDQKLYINGRPDKIVVTDNAKDDSPVYEYSSSNEDVLTVDENGALTPVSVGQATVTVSAPETDNYYGGDVYITFTVSELPSQDLTLETTGTIEKTYGDEAFTNTATNHTQDGGEVTYSSSDESVATVNETTGEVTVTGAGEAVITATAAYVEYTYGMTKVSYTVSVSPKELTVKSVELEEKVYDGATGAKVTKVEFDGVIPTDTLELGKDYTAEAVFADANAGEEKAVNVTVTLLNGNYALADSAIETTGTVKPASAFALTAKDVYMNLHEGSAKTLELSGVKGWKTDMGGEPVLAVLELPAGLKAELKGTALTLTADGTAEDGTEGTLTVSVTGMGNYEDSTVTLTVNFVDELTVEISGVTVEDKTYDGAAAGYTGEATVTEKDSHEAVELPEGELVYKWQSIPTDSPYILDPDTVPVDSPYVVDMDAAPVNAGSYRLVISVMENSMYTGSQVWPFTIAKATLTAAPADITIYVGEDLPTEFEVTYTGFVNGEGPDVLTWTGEPGFVLMDGESPLENSDKAGTYEIVWQDGVQATGVNYNVVKESGTLTIVRRPAPAPTPSTSVKVTKPDNGSFSVSDRYASAGETVDVLPKADEGYVVDAVTVTDKNGVSVQVKDNGDGTYSFVMPAKSAQPVTVKVTFKVKPEEAPAPSSSVFTDLDLTAWYHDGVEYMVGRKLMVGIDDTTFAPNATTTRSMVVSILYRLDGEPEAGSSTFADVPDGLWYSKAVAWAAANKIVSGYSDTQFGPDAPITREQMAAFLYRYAQYKKADLTAENDLSGYADAGKLSSWAEDAMRWAVGNKIIVGLSDTELSPNSLSTRAMVAEILTRYCQIFEK